MTDKDVGLIRRLIAIHDPERQNHMISSFFVRREKQSKKHVWHEEVRKQMREQKEDHTRTQMQDIFAVFNGKLQSSRNLEITLANIVRAYF